MILNITLTPFLFRINTSPTISSSGSNLIIIIFIEVTKEWLIIYYKINFIFKEANKKLHNENINVIQTRIKSRLCRIVILIY